MFLENILNNKINILVAGLGRRSGLFSANFLARKDYNVTVCDSKNEDQLKDLIASLEDGVKVITGNQDPNILEDNIELIVLSPGVPVKIPLIQEAFRRNIPVISEVELAYFFTKGMWIAITGTDGKSTTTALTNFVFKRLGFNSREGGNIGIPLISLAESSTEDTVTVAELSSFQLETIHDFKADAAAFLNLSPDHLDRYESMDDYLKAKLNIVSNQSSNDFFIYNMDDLKVSNSSTKIVSNKKSFSIKSNKANIYHDNGNIVLNYNQKRFYFDTSRLKLLGIHNVMNVMTTMLLAEALYEKKNLEFDPEKVYQCCCEFEGLPHRMEKCETIQNRLFINDSKATTVGAVEMAVKSLPSDAVIILGGRGKGDDYSRLNSILKDKVRGIVLIGETSDDFAEIFTSFNIAKSTDMKDAVVKAFSMSQEGDCILLSPACASFDMYSSYEERGDVFKKEVLNFSGEID